MKKSILIVFLTFQLMLFNSFGKKPVLMANFGHRNNTMAISPNNQMLATGDWDGNLIIWDINKGREIRNTFIQPSIITVAFDKTGNIVFVKTDNSILSYSISSNSIVGDYKIKIEKDGSYDEKRIFRSKPFLLLKNACKIVIIDYTTNKTIFTKQDCQLNFVLSENEKNILVTNASNAKYVSIIDNKTISSFDFTSDFTKIALNPNDQNFITIDADGLLKQWDIAKGNLIKQLKLDLSRINYISYSPDGNFIALINEQKKLLVLNSQDFSVNYQKNLCTRQKIYKILIVNNLHNFC